MRRLTVSLAALSVVLLAGCGAKADGGSSHGTAAGPTGAAATGAAATTAADDGSSGLDSANASQIKFENAMADCMKKKGFRYVPHPLNFGSDANKVAAYAGINFVLAPPDDVRKFRTKYGFGQYSKLVYPNDPAISDPPETVNPNNAIRDALDPAQKKAYDKAYWGDYIDVKKGLKKAGPGTDKGCTGEVAPADPGPSKQDQQAAAREFAKFANDPAVVKATQKYADCLKNKGYRVKDARPGVISQSMFTNWDTRPTGGTVTAATAKAELPKEIKAALDDLDCSLDYGNLARTKYAKAILNGGGVG